MGAGSRWLISLSDAPTLGETEVGAKAIHLAQLELEGFRVPRGYRLPIACYERFLHENELNLTISMELGCKPLPSHALGGDVGHCTQDSVPISGRQGARSGAGCRKAGGGRARSDAATRSEIIGSRGGSRSNVLRGSA
jgi:hypothetical protein